MLLKRKASADFVGKRYRDNAEAEHVDFYSKSIRICTKIVTYTLTRIYYDQAEKPAGKQVVYKLTI